MYSPREAEMAALNKCGALLEELDDNAKLRVLRYLVDVFDLAKHLQMNGTYVDDQRAASNNHNVTPEQKLVPVNSSRDSDNPVKDDEVQFEETSNEYPTLKDIVMRDLPKVETDWVLLYAFYASNFAKDQFVKSDISDKYDESGRRDKQRIKNLSQNFKKCVMRKWLKNISGETYLITVDGKSYAEQIINGNSQGKPRSLARKKTAKSKE
ncbi:hypothetical protein [Hymenobacter cavernae]|uniref:Uncharacterized protein n=1 Tax=Hymenobacter cavernae TaxID=2044852 RepID=A0ABQ1U2S5_9BACT|nr:hypothetical protein [Hymenobacter cavernae]GGF09644.1 hypothetical protein GCM10011383_21050 [Hymenobacter cavernae]